MRESTSMNGAQLEALQRFFRDMEERAAVDLANTEKELHNNRQVENEIERRKTKKNFKQEDDKINLERWASIKEKEKQEKEEREIAQTGDIGEMMSQFRKTQYESGKTISSEEAKSLAETAQETLAKSETNV